MTPVLSTQICALPLNRERSRSKRTHLPRLPATGQRGFSFLELTIALSVMLIFSAVGALALARATAADASATLHRNMDTAVTAQLFTVTHNSVDLLLGDTFNIPTPCPGSALTGSAGQTCLADNSSPGKSWRVNYTAIPGGDPNGSAAAASYIDVTATVVLPDGPLTITQRVAAPTAGYSVGHGIVRVSLTSTPTPLTSTTSSAPMPGQIFLLAAANGTTVIDQAPVSATGIALLRSTPSTCTTANPCMIGLAAASATNSPGAANGMTLGAAAGTPAGQIVVATGGLADIAAVVSTPATLTVRLKASNAGRSGGAPPTAAAGSVCLWLTFTDGAGAHSTPGCNNAGDASTVTFAGYSPASTAIGNYALPTGVPMAVTVDRPDSTCPKIVGATVWSSAAPQGFTSVGAVCTSYTWGVPATFGVFGVAPDPYPGQSVTLTPNSNAIYEMGWSGAAAQPAAGIVGSSEDLWSKPRSVTAAACAHDATCTSLGASYDPEDNDCPATNQHCRSGANATPALTQAAPTAFAYTPGSGAATAFTLGVFDPDLSPTTITITSPTIPAAGTVACGGSTLTAGGTISTVASGSRYDLSCSYNPPSTSNIDGFTLTLTSSTGPAQTVAIGLMPDLTKSYQLTGAAQTVPEGGTSTFTIRDVAGDGSARSGVTIGLSGLPATGVTVGPLTTDSTGVATATITATAAAPTGAFTVIATADNQTGAFQLTVSPSLNTLAVAVSPNSTPQNSSATVSVTARDGTGALMSGAVVNLVALNPDLSAAVGVYPQTAGCVSAATGVCSTPLVAEAAAPAGTYSLRASATTPNGALISPLLATTFTVSAVPAKILSSPFTLVQGGTFVQTVTVVDGTGQPVRGQTVAFASTAGISNSGPSAGTDLSGKTSTIYTAASNATTGTINETMTAGGASGSSVVVIAPTAATAIQTGGTLTLLAGASGSTGVKVSDGSTAAMPGAQVQLQAPDLTGTAGFPTGAAGIAVSARLVTDGGGSAAAVVTVGALVPAGSYTISGTVLTSSTGSVPVTFSVFLQVNASVDSMTLVGTVPQGSSGTLAVRLRNSAGNSPGITSASFTFDDSCLTAPAVNTLSDGTANLTVTDAGSPSGTCPSRAGFYTVTVTANGGSFQAPVQVVAAIASLSVTSTAVNIAQNTAGGMRLTALDAKGDGVPGSYLTATAAGSAPALTFAVSPTDSTGAATLTTLVGANKASSTAGITVTVTDDQGSSTTFAVYVTPTATTITTSPTSMSIAHNTSASVTATVLDAFGTPITGAPITVSSSDALVSATPTGGVTTAAGWTTVIAVDNTKTSGTATLTFTSGNATQTVVVTAS